MFFSLFLTAIQAEPVQIRGTLPGAEKHEIRLLQLADRISYRTIILDRTIVSDSANFSLTCDINETAQLILDIDYYSSVLYVVPGSEYALSCEPVDIAGQYRPFYKKDILQYAIMDEPKPQINAMINDFELLYAGFVERELSGIYHKRNTGFIKAFRQEMDSSLTGQVNDFIRNYIDYRLADLEFIIAPSKRNQLFRNFIGGRPVLYNNPEYMNFFQSFFDDFILQHSKFISRRDLQSTINQLGNYPALLDSLGKDTLLRNEVVRELVLLQSVRELYADQSFSKANLIRILDQLAGRTKFEIHREIARNLRKELTHLEPGTLAPDIKLPTLDHDTVRLSDFREKPVYLSFFTTWSYACLAEFELMDSLWQQFGDRIDFITISLDKSPEVMDRLRKEKNYNWTFLYNGSGYDVIHAYRVKTFPSFVFISADGKIIDYPAYKPSELIAERFRANLQKKE